MLPAIFGPLPAMLNEPSIGICMPMGKPPMPPRGKKEGMYGLCIVGWPGVPLAASVALVAAPCRREHTKR